MEIMKSYGEHRYVVASFTLRRHLLDPQRQKSSIIPQSLVEPVTCSDSSPCLGEQDRDRYSRMLKTDHPREVIEAALGHVVRNRVEAAYARSDLFEPRRTLMDDWAGYLARGMGGGSGALGVNKTWGLGRLHRRRGCASERVAGLRARNNTRTTALFDTLIAFSKREASGMESPYPRPGNP